MAKKAVEQEKVIHGEAAAAVNGGGKRFLVGLPAPAVHLVIEAPSEVEAIAAYNRLAGVISTEQRHEVEEIQAEPAKG